MALLNRVSANTISSCFDLLTLPVCLLINRKVSTIFENLDATKTGAYPLYVGYIGVSALYHLGIYPLRGKFNQYLENVAIRALNTDDGLAHPYQQLMWVSQQVECRDEITERLCRAMADDRLPSAHLRVILDVFTAALNINMRQRSIELLKMRSILTTLSLYPKLSAAAATQAIVQMGQCSDTTLKILDQIHIWTMAETVFEPLESGYETGWRDLLLRIQLVYNESALMETMYSIKYSSWPIMAGDQRLAEHYQSALICTVYKRILSQAGVCTFLSSPARILQQPLICRFAVPDADVFYQFQKEFRQRLHDTDAFFQFTKDLMAEKEAILLQRHPRLRLQIDKRRNQSSSRFNHLLHLQEQGRISESKCLEYGQDLMKRHNQEIDKIWLYHIGRAFSRIPARLKNANNHREVPPNLSLTQLINRYK